MMDREQAEFFRAKLLPIVREAAEDDMSETRYERNPLRPMLRQLLGYIEYLEAKVKAVDDDLSDDIYHPA